mgnify:CR=1 FL=1
MSGKVKTVVKSTVWKDKNGVSHSRVRVMEDGVEVSSHTSTGANHEEAISKAHDTMRSEHSDNDDVLNAPVEFEPPPTPGSSPSPSPPPKSRDSDGDGIPDEIDRVEGAADTLQKGRNHVPWAKKKATKGEKTRLFDGRNNMSMQEPVPQYLSRPGDRVIRADTDGSGGVNNNAAIILGRDRSSIGEVWSPWTNTVDLKSGFSDHMAAGAIDLVVGRMAPYPIDGIVVQGKKKPLRLAPIFKTKYNENVSTSVSLHDEKTGETRSHPGIAMDAARIYLSQMTEIDKNFGFTKLKRDFAGVDAKKSIDEKVKQNNDKYQVPEEDKYPTSGIGVVADKVRLYARQDIKIMTGGTDYQGSDNKKLEQYNSQGNKVATIGGIHLIAGNGSGEDQEPIPKGNTLVAAMEDLVDLVDNLSGIVDGLTQAQMEFNGALMNHFHQSPLLGFPTTPSLVAQVMGVKTMADHIARVKVGVMFLKNNVARFKLNHLNVSGDGYICSRYNTTN